MSSSAIDMIIMIKFCEFVKTFRENVKIVKLNKLLNFLDIPQCPGT